MIHRAVLVVISSLFLGSLGRAEADSVTYTASLNTFTQDAFVPGFSSSYGTLLEVDFSVTASGGNSYFYEPEIDTIGTFVTHFSFNSILGIPPYYFPLGSPSTTSSFSSSSPKTSVIRYSTYVQIAQL